MANTIYMNLNLPVVSTTIGPAWATLVNAAIDTIDAHDHSSGKGTTIPTSGININANLNLNSYSPYNCKSIKFSSQAAALSGATNASSVYVANGNLYFTNSAGTAVQITSGASVSSSPTSVIAFSYTAATDIVILAGDTFSYVAVDCSTAPRTVTLPSAAAVSAGRFYVVKDSSGSAQTNAITITPDGTDTVDNLSTYSLNVKDGSIILVSDGNTNWHIA